MRFSWLVQLEAVASGGEEREDVWYGWDEG